MKILNPTILLIFKRLNNNLLSALRYRRWPYCLPKSSICHTRKFSIHLNWQKVSWTSVFFLFSIIQIFREVRGIACIYSICTTEPNLCIQLHMYSCTDERRSTSIELTTLMHVFSNSPLFHSRLLFFAIKSKHAFCSLLI